MSFLSVFTSILHAVEVAAKIAAPIIATQDPVIGALMSQATNAAVLVEAAIPAPGSGPAKAAAVQASTQATVDAINGILASQCKAALPANTTNVVQQQVQTLVAGLNAVQAAVGAAPSTIPAKGV